MLATRTLSWLGGRDCIFFAILYYISEKDLSQVLQMRAVYTNVAQGVIAKNSDLNNAFKTSDIDKICIEILKY